MLEFPLFCSEKYSMFVLMIWQFIVWFFSIPSYILPSPFSVFLSIPEHGKLVLYHAFITSTETLLGLFLAIIVGVFSSLLFILFPKLYKKIHPVFLCLQSIPTFILLPLFLIWFGHGWSTKIIIIALSCYFPITSCLYHGLMKTPQCLLDQAFLWKAKPYKVLLHIRFMHALPSLFAGLRLTVTQAPLCVLAVDWIGASSGLGYLIMLSHNQLEMNLLFLSLICIILLTFGFHRFVLSLEKYFVFWPHS